ncbi:MAG TPA: hypothetical protein VFE51_29810 [Verrucomicrobiae bacterium]|nr:hypothetical protein [Verrucomicrobiae bacterium]
MLLATPVCVQLSFLSQWPDRQTKTIRQRSTNETSQSHPFSIYRGLVLERAVVFERPCRVVLGFDAVSRFLALVSALCLLDYECLECTRSAHLIFHVLRGLGCAPTARSGWHIIVFLLAGLARIAKVMKNRVPNPLLLATAVYNMLSFLCQRSAAPEPDRSP